MEYWEWEGYFLCDEGCLKGIMADDILQRLYFVTNIVNQVEFAQLVNCRQSSISDTRRRNIMSLGWIKKVMEQFENLSPVWLLTGQGDAQGEERSYSAKEIAELFSDCYVEGKKGMVRVQPYFKNCT